MTLYRGDAAIAEDAEKWVGRSIPRFEDAALVTGSGRFIDDLGTSRHSFVEFCSAAFAGRDRLSTERTTKTARSLAIRSKRWLQGFKPKLRVPWP